MESIEGLTIALVMEVERITGMGAVNVPPLELIIEGKGFDRGRAVVHMTRSARDRGMLPVVDSRASAERERNTNIILCPSNPMVHSLKRRWCVTITRSDLVIYQKLAYLCLGRGYKKDLF